MCPPPHQALQVLRAVLPMESFCQLHARAVDEARLGCGGVEHEWDNFAAVLLHWVGGRALGQADPATLSAPTVKSDFRTLFKTFFLLQSRVHPKYFIMSF